MGRPNPQHLTPGSNPHDLRRVCAAYVAQRASLQATAKHLGACAKRVRALVRSPEGVELIAQLTQELLDQYRVDAERVVGEAAAIAFADLPTILESAADIDGLAALPPHLRAAIAEVTFEGDGRTLARVKLQPKLPALQLLAQYLGLAGLSETGEAQSGRSELGGLTIIGPTAEATDHAGREQQRRIPQPERVD